MSDNPVKILDLLNETTFLKNKKRAFKHRKTLSNSNFVGLDCDGVMFYAKYDNIVDALLKNESNTRITINILQFCKDRFYVTYEPKDIKLGEFELLPLNYSEFEFLSNKITPREKLAKASRAYTLLNSDTWFDREVLSLYENDGTHRLVRYLGAKGTLGQKIKLEDVETNQVLSLNLLDFMDKWIVCNR